MRNKLLKTIGVAGIVLAVLVVPLSALHSVLSAGAAWLAIILGGVAGLGRGRSLKLGLAAILIALASALLMASYTGPAGLQMPDRSAVFQIFVFFAVPLFASLVLIVIGRSGYWRIDDQGEP